MSSTSKMLRSNGHCLTKFVAAPRIPAPAAGSMSKSALPRTACSLLQCSTTTMSYSFSSNADSSSRMSQLKAMVKPFMLKCHPDVQTSSVAKRVNMTAMQNLNGYLDLMEATCSSSINSSSRPVEWPKSIVIEFLMSMDDTENRMLKTKSKKSSWSRRRVELVVPSKKLREAVQTRERENAIEALHGSARQELRKVLTVAGLPIPALYEEQDAMEQAWRDELDFLQSDKSSAPNQRFRDGLKRPMTRYDASKERFVKSLNHKRLQQMYDEALRDAQADLETQGLIGNHERWRQEFVNGVIGRVRIDKRCADEIDLTEQLIALRRLSLLLKDNFDELQMEDMGKLWEDLCIVLQSQRAFTTSSSALHKRKKRMQESGFRFSYNANHAVTIHVPIDFGDEELVQELQENLEDFYNLSLADDLGELYVSPIK